MLWCELTSGPIPQNPRKANNPKGRCCIGPFFFPKGKSFHILWDFPFFFNHILCFDSIFTSPVL